MHRWLTRHGKDVLPAGQKKEKLVEDVKEKEGADGSGEPSYCLVRSGEGADGSGEPSYCLNTFGCHLIAAR